MNAKNRKLFDRQVEKVLGRLPRKVHRLLEEVPLHVEDHPPRWLRKELGVANPCGLLGCFSGVSIDEIYERYANIPNMISIYREGIAEFSRNEDGRVDMKELRHQIRITILHELGHYFGLDEDDLDEIGYG